MQDFWRRFRRDRLAVIGLGLILVLLVLGLFAPVVAPYDPNQQFFDGLTLEGAPLPPGERFWLGTDMLGRDLFSRLLYGARTSLIIGIVANGIAVMIGTLLGVIAGYLRGWIGGALMRFTDLMMAFPALLLAIVLAAIFKPEPVDRRRGHRAGQLGADRARHLYRDDGRWRSASSSRRSARSAPAPLRILFRHILPHLVPTIIVWGTLGIATTVLLEATLSFLGVGVQPPTAVLGQHHLREPDLFPQRALAGVHSRARPSWSLALAFNLVGDAPARHPRSDPEGAAADDRLSRPPARCSRC